jgi:hypothetical protein
MANITLSISENSGFFKFNGIDYPKGHFTLKYDGDLTDDTPAGRNFSLFSIFDGKKLISSRHYSEVTDVTSWDGLSKLLVYLGVLESLGQAVTPYRLAVQQGKVSGHSIVDKFGINHSVTEGTDPEDIWENGGVYIYDADGSAPIVSLVSDNAADTNEIIIQGLDINGDEVEQTITLTGTTRVALTVPLWRVYRMTNDSNFGITGLVQCYIGIIDVPITADIRAVIDNGHNQTLMALYTIPKGKVGFLWRGELGIQLTSGGVSTQEFAHCHYESRRFGKVFTIKKSVTLLSNGNSNYIDVRSFPDPIPSLTDIKLRASEVSTDMGLWGTFDIELIDETEFSLAYLQAIGQPNF